jgi:hypothetical protein
MLPRWSKVINDLARDLADVDRHSFERQFATRDPRYVKEDVRALQIACDQPLDLIEALG